jgi:hypothetical protein
MAVFTSFSIIILIWLVLVSHLHSTGFEPSQYEAALLTVVPSPRHQANESLALSPERRTASISRGLVVIGLSMNVATSTNMTMKLTPSTPKSK